MTVLVSRSCNLSIATSTCNVLLVVSLYWRRNDGRGSVFYFTCMLSAKMYVHYKKQNDCAQKYLFSMELVNTEDIQSKQNDGSGVQKSCNRENDWHVQMRASCMHGCLLNRSLQHMSANDISWAHAKTTAAEYWSVAWNTGLEASRHFSRNDGPGSDISSKGIVRVR